MLTQISFWVLIGFYVTVKLCLFVGVYVITKAIERRALAQKRKNLEARQLYEVESLKQKRFRDARIRNRDRELFGAQRRRFVG